MFIVHCNKKNWKRPKPSQEIWSTDIGTAYVRGRSDVCYTFIVTHSQCHAKIKNCNVWDYHSRQDRILSLSLLSSSHTHPPVHTLTVFGRMQFENKNQLSEYGFTGYLLGSTLRCCAVVTKHYYFSSWSVHASISKEKITLKWQSERENTRQHRMLEKDWSYRFGLNFFSSVSVISVIRCWWHAIACICVQWVESGRCQSVTTHLWTRKKITNNNNEKNLNEPKNK